MQRIWINSMNTSAPRIFAKAQLIMGRFQSTVNWHNVLCRFYFQSEAWSRDVHCLYSCYDYVGVQNKLLTDIAILLDYGILGTILLDSHIRLSLEYFCLQYSYCVAACFCQMSTWLCRLLHMQSNTGPRWKTKYVYIYVYIYIYYIYIYATVIEIESQLSVNP